MNNHTCARLFLNSRASSAGSTHIPKIAHLWAGLR